MPASNRASILPMILLSTREATVLSGYDPPVARFEELRIPLSDGYSAYARHFRPDRSIGAVLYHHGIQSHCGWYEQSALALADAGYDVLQFDRRGSGRNTVDRGHAESAEQLIADARAAHRHLSSRSGRKDHHVVGVSWGGKLAVAAYVDHPADVRSLTLVTPGLFPKIGVSRGEMARIGFAMLYEPTRIFDIPLNDPELFTTNPTWAEFFRDDPHTLRQCTAAFYLASRRMDRIVARLKDAPPVPVHLFLAGDERIVDNDRTLAFFDSLDWPDVTCTWHQSARHSLEFESDAQRYFKQLTDFVTIVDRVKVP